MKNFIRKLYIVIIALFLAVAGEAHSSCFIQQECEDPCYCASDCNFCGQGFIRADFLYWKAHQEGFTCECDLKEINNFIDSTGNVVTKFKGHNRDPHFEWDPGFRLGTGYDLGCDNWDVGIFWTHFHTRTKNQHEGKHHRFNWKLDYDVIDLAGGRKISLCAFTIRPFIGIRATEIKQKVKSKAITAYNIFLDASSSESLSSSSSESSSSSSLSNSFLDKKHNKATFRGIGPLIGIEADWNLGCGFSLFACGAVSGLYGHYNVKLNEFNTFLNGTNICHGRKHFHSYQIATDASIGVSWEHCLCNDMLVTFQLALEQHCYFRHNRLGDHGNLCFDGGTFSAAIAY